MRNPEAEPCASQRDWMSSMKAKALRQLGPGQSSQISTGVSLWCSTSFASCSGRG